MVMDVELSSHHHLLPLRPPCSFLASPAFLSPHMCHHTHFGNILRFALSLRSRSTLVRPLMSSKRGHSRANSEGLCEVVWTVEADLAKGQLLYVTGDPDALGSWQPEMATLLHPTETANLWKAAVKIPSGVDCKYNYFIKPETSSSHDIVWRPGPQFSVLMPSTVKHNQIVVRDSWTKFNTERSPANVWGSWIEETYEPLAKLGTPTSALTDEKESIQQLKVYSEEQALEFNDNAIINGHHGLRSVCSERNQPVEEPWLLQSSIILPVPKDLTRTDISKDDDTAEGKVTEVDFSNQRFIVHEKQMAADGSTVPSQDDSVSTIILINSSICSLQRIAVLEDGKLVELLLEPAKSNVQCNSVYLGVVTELVPHMGGAFVNIGSSRASLLSIKKNREPFIFPPFCQRGKKKKVNGSVLEPLKEHPSVLENGHSSDDVEVTDDVMEFVSKDDLESFMHDNHDEIEVDDDFDISETKENVNGARVGNGKMVANFEHDLLEQVHNLGDKVINSSDPIEAEVSVNTHISQSRDIKDPLCSTSGNKWARVCKGTKIVVQVVKEGLGTKGPALTAYPKLNSRFWVLITRTNKIGVSKKIAGVERTRLKVIAKNLKPAGFGILARSASAGHSLEELQKDLHGLLSTWKNIMEQAKSAALAADEGVTDAVPVILHRAMNKTVSVVQDYFNEKGKKIVVDSRRTYHEVTNYLQDIAPDLCDRVELYEKRIPLFDEFNIEEEINNILSKRVPLAGGGSLVIEQTEALVSIDVNGGLLMFGHQTSQEKACLDVNLAAAKQIAREIRLRDIGGIIVVDFIDMADDSNKRLVYEEMKRAVARDRSSVTVSELSKHGLMEMTRKRVRPSVTYMITEPCTCCHATGRVQALDTSFSKIEQEICRQLATQHQKADPGIPLTWPTFTLRVDHYMNKYMTSGKRTKLAVLISALKVWIILKVARGFARGTFEVKLCTDDEAKNNPYQGAISSVLQVVKNSTVNSGRKMVPVKKGKSTAKWISKKK